MIVVDNVPLTLSVTPDQKARWAELTPNEQWAVEQILKIKERKEVTLYDPSPINRKYFFKPSRGFDLVGYRINASGMREKWVFCDSPVLNNTTGHIRYPAKHLNLRNSATYFTNTNADIAFFLTNPEIKLDKIGFKIEDRAGDAIVKVESRKQEAEISHWINNKLTNADIKALSYRWGLSDVHDKSDAELREELYDTVKAYEIKKDPKRNYKLFLKELESDTDVAKIASYFNVAVEKGLITFNKSNRTCVYKNTDEKIGGVIPPVSFASNSADYMIDYLVDHPEEWDLFSKTISGQLDQVAFDIDDYKSITNTGKLRSWAISKGYNSVKMSPRVEMIEAIDKLIQKTD
jgi:hypothetical protein